MATPKAPKAAKAPKTPKQRRRRKIVWIVAGSLLVILIAFRIALPYILLRFVNKELQTIPGYTGHVDDIDVALIRGAYTIKTIKLDPNLRGVEVVVFKGLLPDLFKAKSLFRWPGIPNRS